MIYNKNLIQQIWEKAIPVLNQNSAHVRKDKCGAWIVFEAYGDRNSEYGWELTILFLLTREEQMI